MPSPESQDSCAVASAASSSREHLLPPPTGCDRPPAAALGGSTQWGCGHVVAKHGSGVSALRRLAAAAGSALRGRRRPTASDPNRQGCRPQGLRWPWDSRSFAPSLQRTLQIRSERAPPLRGRTAVTYSGALQAAAARRRPQITASEAVLSAGSTLLRAALFSYTDYRSYSHSPRSLRGCGTEARRGRLRGSPGLGCPQRLLPPPGPAAAVPRSAPLRPAGRRRRQRRVPPMAPRGGGSHSNGAGCRWRAEDGGSRGCGLPCLPAPLS